ncbi:MAG: hypothetical protein M3680_17355, partial [Myxococcota bacterium]|nr:hypothetical protein [Myxococcota bacterium]
LHAPPSPPGDRRPWQPLDDAASRGWAAVWAVAQDGAAASPAVIATLEALAPRDPVFAGALRFARHLALRSPAIPAGSPAQALELLALAEVFHDAGFLEPAQVAYAGWLAAYVRGARAVDEGTRGRELGAGLVLGFSSNDDGERETQLAASMYRAWPADAGVVEIYARAIQYEQPKRALQAIRKQLARQPSAELAGLRDEILADGTTR